MYLSAFSHPLCSVSQQPVSQGLKACLVVGCACYRLFRYFWSVWLCAKRVRLKESERFSPVVTQAATRELCICFFPREEV